MKKNSGFTLIEMAIVLVIIGLLLGGVLKGQALIDSSKVTSMIKQMDQLKVAIYTFQDRYHAMPGDMSNASTVVGNGALDCASSCNDGFITAWPNTSLVTNNLSAAGLYSGPSGTAEVNGQPTALNCATKSLGWFDVYCGLEWFYECRW